MLPILRLRTPTTLLCRIPSSLHSLHHAHQLYDEMLEPHSPSYDSAIAVHCRNGHVAESYTLLTRLMASPSNTRPTRFTFVPILSSHSLPLSNGTQLHSLLVKTGLLHSDPYSATALLGHYAKNRRIWDAAKLFDEMPVRTVVTWNCIVSGFAQTGCVQNSFFLFRELLRSEIRPSDCSLLGVLSGCRSLEDSCLVEQVHGLVVKLSMDWYSVVLNVLLSAYAMCFSEHVMARLFSDLPVRDLVSWNTSIAALAKSDAPERALEFFFRMLLEGFLPNESTLTSALVACVGANLHVCGELIHAVAIKLNLGTSVYVGSTLVDFYAKCKSVEDSRVMFNEIPDKNLVTWNALVLGYSNGNSGAPLVVLKEMMHASFKPNEFTLSSILRKATALDLKQLHSLIIRMGYDNNPYVLTALISSYGAHDMISDALACSTISGSNFHVAPNNVIAGIHNRMGQYEVAKDLLFELQDPDTISWNILVSACAKNGDYSEAFQFFKSMQVGGYLLDNYMAVSLLSICSKSNNLGLGSTLHGLIIKCNAGSSETFVGNVLMDMYGKCGSLENCLRVFEKMEQRNLISWTALISGLGLHGCTLEALERFREMELDGWKPDRVAFLAVLSACRHGGLVEEGMSLFEKMKSVYGIEAEMDHYVILVDLLCKYGYIKEAEELINGMPFQPNVVIWRTFLHCKMYSTYSCHQRKVDVQKNPCMNRIMMI